MKRLLAFNIGASSGRVIVRTLNDNHLTLDEIYRFPNSGIRKDDSFLWNISGIYAYYTSIEVPKILKNYPFVVIRGHRIFAKGMTLEDALQYVTGAEQSAYIRYLTLMTGKPLKRDFSKEKEFSNW